MDEQPLDLLVIGAGPAGLSAAAQAQANDMRCVVVERSDHIADTVFCYQKQKYVMAEPSLVPLRSPLPFAVGTREEVLATWQRVVAERGIRLVLGCEVLSLDRQAGVFCAGTTRGEYRARQVVVAIGTQGNPRRLGAEGEERPHVVSRLLDPDAHEDHDIVVVGAGDSALEVALSLTERNRVHLIVRGSEIVRAKESLERKALAAAAGGLLHIHFRTTVSRVLEETVELEGPGGQLAVAADQVILKIGADPPRALLEGWGVTFTSPARDALPVTDQSYQTAVPGLYLIGAAGGSDLIKLGINQGYEVVEYILERPVDPADEEVLRARLPHWPGVVRKRLAILRDAIPLFQGASLEQLREVFLLASIHDLAAGTVVTRQNDYADSLLAVVEGRVAISAQSADGEQRRVVELSAGSFFGEMGLISGRRRNATATAIDHCRLIEVPRKAMLKLMHTAPAVQAEVDRAFLVRGLSSYLLPNTSESTLWRLVERARLQSLPQGKVLFEEGDAGEAFYIIRRGMVKVSRRSGDRDMVLTYLGAGNYFGESALLDSGPRTATVSAIFPTELIVLDRPAFATLLAEQPELRATLRATLEKRQVESLVAEGRPGGGDVLDQLIGVEAVIGTDVLVIDNHSCVRCGNCVAACEGVHDDRHARLSLTGSELGNLLFPNSCMQCENPLCMLDCPPDAIVRRSSGEIQIKDTCIGCGNCATNCPYDNIFMVHPKPARSPFGWLRRLFDDGDGANDQSSESGREVAVKCDLCVELSGGPACVRSCPTGAAIRLKGEDLRPRIEMLVREEVRL